MSDIQGFLLISKFVHLKFQKRPGWYYSYVKISTKLLKFLQPVVEHNELSVSLRGRSKPLLIIMPSIRPSCYSSRSTQSYTIP